MINKQNSEIESNIHTLKYAFIIVLFVFFGIVFIGKGLISVSANESQTLESFTQTIVEKQKIENPDGGVQDLFGGKVAIYGEWAVIGGVLSDYKEANSGTAFIYRRTSSDTWVKYKRLVPPNGGKDELFGLGIAIYGDTIAIGARFANSKKGAVYIFQKDKGGINKWGFVKELKIDINGKTYFGESLAIHKNQLIVSAPYDQENGINSGAVYIYDRNQGGSNKWGLTKKIVADDGKPYATFGASVAIHDGYALVGASNDDTNGKSNGAAYLFHINSGGTNNWGKIKKLYSSNMDEFKFFGSSVAISKEYIVVGAKRELVGTSKNGTVYIFDKSKNGLKMGLYTKIKAPDGIGGAEFGNEVVISNNTIVVGAFRDSQSGPASGSAYVFRKNGNTFSSWEFEQKLFPQSGNSFDSFGNSIGMHRNTIIIGSFAHDIPKTNSGAAYIFK